MSWAGRRRLIILLIIGGVVVALLAIVLSSVLYKAPSCFDGIQNEGETGIDCGGPCAPCASQEEAPTVLFTKAVSNGQGRIDVVAEIENKNGNAAAQNVSYTITLYGTGQTLIGQASGTVDLPPSATVPIFVPGLASGNPTISGAFLTLNSPSIDWISMSSNSLVVPTVSTPQLGGTVSAPSITASLMNASPLPMTNIRAIVLVHDSSGDVIAASATVVPRVPAQGSATAFFNWNGPFVGTPALIEVIPVIPLP
jgi:hypothetical protein